MTRVDRTGGKKKDKMERFVCSSLPCPCWPCQPVPAPSQLSGFAGSRNFGLAPLAPHAQLVVPVPWRSPSLADTRCSHLPCPTSALWVPRRRRRGHCILPSWSHISTCEELQLVSYQEQAKEACAPHSGSPAQAATIPKCFPCSSALCMHSPFPKVQDSPPGLPLTKRFGLFVGFLLLFGWLFF